MPSPYLLVHTGTDEKIIRAVECESELEVVPKYTQYRDIPAVVETMDKSIANDPLEQYMMNTPDAAKHRKRWQTGRKVLMYLSWFGSAHGKDAWTVNHGQSIMRISTPYVRKGQHSKLFDELLAITMRTIRYRTQTKEQSKRTKEFATKLASAVHKLIGDRTQNMIELGGLGTAPEYQGRGYASALVHVATALADTQGRAIWLASSNIANHSFYELFGFRTVGTIYIGEGNPSWTEPPIPVEIMVREPQTALTSLAHSIKPTKSTLRTL